MKKKLLSVVLTALMILSMGVSVFAAGSPTIPDDKKPKNPGYVRSSDFDVNSQDHIHNIVKTKIGQKTIVVRSVTSLNGDAKSELHLRTARTIDNKRVPITHLGNGNTGLFDTKTGSYVKYLAIRSQKKVTIRANAFLNSHVERLYLSSSFFVLEKDCFKGTKKSNMIITLDGDTKYSGRIVFEKGCFNGLTSGAKIIVSSKCCTRVTFNRIKKNALAAGFPGQIIYK
jgi:hypothetical protein